MTTVRRKTSVGDFHDCVGAEEFVSDRDGIGSPCIGTEGVEEPCDYAVTAVGTGGCVGNCRDCVGFDERFEESVANDDGVCSCCRKIVDTEGIEESAADCVENTEGRKEIVVLYS